MRPGSELQSDVAAASSAQASSPPLAPTGPTGTAELTDPVDDPRTDHQLLTAHVDGDPQAFALLVSRHRDRLWAIALRTMRNPDEAADALQDAYISAFRRADSFRGEAAVTTWLHRVVVNACLDRLRRNKVRRADPLPDDVDRVAEFADRSTRVDPLEAKEQRAVIAQALSQITDDQRAALVLVDMEGYSVEESARILGCAVGTIKSRCSRGRAKLVPLLSHLRDAG